MFEAFEYDRWDHTASMLCCIAGLVKKGVEVKDFHPYRRAEVKSVPTAKAIHALKSILPKWKDPGGKS